MSVIENPSSERLEELTALITLQQIEQLGPVGIAALLMHSGTASNLFRRPVNLNSVVGLRAKAREQLSVFFVILARIASGKKQSSH